MRRIAIVSGIFVVALGLSANAFADFCLNADNGINYRLQVGTGNPAAGTPIVISGTRTISTFQTPVFGTLISTSAATLIGLTEVFNFGSGSFTHPNGTTVMSFPKVAPFLNRYDTTFHGNGAPHNVMGFVSQVACPASEPVASSAKDPNGKE
jgi:hypothetical protein